MSTAKLPPLESLPDKIRYSYNGDKLRNVAIAFTVLEVLFVFLRFLSKRIGSVRFGSDDWLLVPSLLLCVGLNASSLIALNIAGLGHHTVVLAITAPEKIVLWQKMLVVTPILYSAAICTSKLVILVFYLRIFVTKFQRIATWTIMGVVIATALADIIATGFQCIPLQRFWDRTVPGHCFNYNMFYRYGSLPNPITDIMMLLLPIPVVWSLRSNIKVKIGLTLTFMTGSLGSIAAIIRTYAFFRKNALGDATWSGGILYIWIVIEPGCYLIAACLICLRPLLNYVTGRSPDSQNKSKRSTSFSRFTGRLSSIRATNDSALDRPIPLIRRDFEIIVQPQSKGPHFSHKSTEDVESFGR